MAAQAEAMIRKKKRKALHSSVLSQILFVLTIVLSFVFPYLLLLFYANFTTIFFGIVLETFCAFSAYVLLLADGYREDGKFAQWWAEFTVRLRDTWKEMNR